MCELLVKAKDGFNLDPVKDLGRYKRGDIVVVMPDGHTWGTKECPPDFLVVKVLGLSVLDAKAYVISGTNLAGNWVRRRYQLPVSDAWIVGSPMTINKSTFSNAVQLKPI